MKGKILCPAKVAKERILKQLKFIEMKNVKNFGVEEMGHDEKIILNGGGKIAYWIGYIAGNIVEAIGNAGEGLEN